MIYLGRMHAEDLSNVDVRMRVRVERVDTVLLRLAHTLSEGG